MSRLATSFVLGYHGCDEDVGLCAISGVIDVLQSDQDFDWLGPGAYFWEADPLRALEWAREKAGRGRIERPFVLGAVIDLRNCLDLVNRDDLEFLKAAHASFIEVQQKAGHPVPVNRDIPGDSATDRKMRFLDCAVIRHLHSIVATDPTLEPFDTVRGMFTEGGPLFPESGFSARAHVQIAVRSPGCIKGLFRPLPPPGS